MRLNHYWDAPKVGNVPGPTTIVVRSRCGMTMNLPAWRVREWEGKSPAANAVPNPCPTCAGGDA